MVYAPIGIIHTTFEKCTDTPIQSNLSNAAKGHIELFPEFAEGLQDLSGFTHIILIYHFHLVNSSKLKVIPFLDTQERGIFATRAPVRPNSIGISTVRLTGIENNMLYIENLDMVDGTPLMDIKPFIPDFDQVADVKCGWLSGKIDAESTQLADDRFKN